MWGREFRRVLDTQPTLAASFVFGAIGLSLPFTIVPMRYVDRICLRRAFLMTLGFLIMLCDIKCL